MPPSPLDSAVPRSSFLTSLQQVIWSSGNRWSWGHPVFYILSKAGKHVVTFSYFLIPFVFYSHPLPHISPHYLFTVFFFYVEECGTHRERWCKALIFSLILVPCVLLISLIYVSIILYLFFFLCFDNALYLFRDYYVSFCMIMYFLLSNPVKFSLPYCFSFLPSFSVNVSFVWSSHATLFFFLVWLL